MVDMTFHFKVRCVFRCSNTRLGVLMQSDTISLNVFFLSIICSIPHVLLCNITQRVSFWFVVTDPSKNHTLPAVEIQSALS